VRILDGEPIHKIGSSAAVEPIVIIFIFKESEGTDMDDTNSMTGILVSIASLLISSGFLAGVLKYLTNRINESDRLRNESMERAARTHEEDVKRQEALERGVQALLRDRLIKIHDDYCPKNEIPLHVKDNFDNLYQQYHALGKNGVMDSFHEEVMELPTTPEAH